MNFFRAANYAPFKSPTYQPTAWFAGQAIVMSKAVPAEGESGVPGKLLAITEKGWVIGTGTEPIRVRKVNLPDGLELKPGDVLVGNPESRSTNQEDRAKSKEEEQNG